MEREIIFSAKAVNTEMWVYGDLVHNQKVTKEGLEPRTMVGGYEVYKDTVCQFTGQTDKNVKRIYEHDILFDGLNHWLVYYNQDECCFALKDLEFECGQDGVLNTSYAKKAEVVGNKFDNPKLLKEKREYPSLIGVG